MPISYALLLCIPLGFVFFLIARFCLRYLMGHYGQTERRGALAFGVFGALLIPYLWTCGCLQDFFPHTPYMIIAFLLLLVEWLILIVLFRPFPRRDMDKSEPKDQVEAGGPPLT